MNKEKNDADLGRKVHEHLLEVNLETPMTTSFKMTSRDEKLNELTHLFDRVLDVLGMDRNDDSICETPKRVAKMYVDELLYGMDYDNFPKCTTVENKMHYNEMVIEKNVRVLSLCEHHLATIDGYATIAYIPNGRVLGLSKIPRIVNFFARRGQIQERLTAQIAEALKFILNTQNVAVSITGKHYCVIARGVQDRDALTTTNAISGIFSENPATRAEFFSMVGRGHE